jgi:Recombinase
LANAVLPIIEEIERAGITSHNAIATKLNERNVRTARGDKWTHVQVGAVLRPFVGKRGRRVMSGLK